MFRESKGLFNPGHNHEIAKLTILVESASRETMYLLVLSTTHGHGIFLSNIPSYTYWCTLPFRLCYRTPFVLGTSLRPVLSIAWRIARANALNADSELSCVIRDMKTASDHELTDDGHSRRGGHRRAAYTPMPWQTSRKYAVSFRWTDLRFFLASNQDW
jgi:hypothetical protein